MAFKYVRQVFTDGMDQDADPVAIDFSMTEDQTVPVVSSVQNLTFERNLLVSRPVPTPGFFTLAETLLSMATTYIGPQSQNAGALVLSVTGGTYNLRPFGYNSFGLNSPLTGSGFGTGANWFHYFLSNASVNGVVLIGGNNKGLIRWDPTTTAYTFTATTTPWAFVTKLYSRAIGAYKLTGAITDPLTIGASAAGNETDWTSLNAYTNILADVNDDITGLAVLRGIVVVCRRYGFHLGFPTGTFPALFNWSCFSDGDIGPAHAASIATFMGYLYFISDYGIHRFNLSNIEDIGEGVYKEIATFINSNQANTSFNPAVGIPHGFISLGWKGDYRPTYNIIIDNSIFPGLLSPHWQYDIVERKWTRSLYDTTSSVAPTLAMPVRFYLGSSNALQDNASQNYILTGQRLTNSAKLFLVGSYGEAQVTDQPLVVTTGALTVSASIQESTVSRVLVHFFLGGSAKLTQPTLQVTSVLDQTSTTLTFQAQSDAQPGWNRVWFNGRAVGQEFQSTLTFAAGYTWPVKLKEMVFEFTDIAKTRS